MATLPTRSFSTIVSTIVAGIQGRASQLIDFGEGSPLRAIAEGFAGAFLWLQAIALQILAASRLSTSSGVDVDTFTADFMPVVTGSQSAALPNGSPRLGAQVASGLLTFARYTPGPTSCFIPVGATAQTVDGSQNFAVIADPALPTFSATLNGYTLAANLPSITVPAQAVVPGAAGNVQAGTITVVTAVLTGIDTLTNLAGFTNGADQESDSALKQRFAAYILGLSRGDVYGLTAAVEGAEVNLQWKLVENYQPVGQWDPGFFFVVADDGSGAPSPEFMAAITNAAWSVRPLTARLTVIPPRLLYVSVSLIIATAPGYDHNTVVGLVSNAIANGINSLGLGNDLDYNRIPAWAYSVPGVISISALLVNGLSGDAAHVSASVPTLDGYATMPLISIKTNSVEVS